MNEFSTSVCSMDHFLNMCKQFAKEAEVKEIHLEEDFDTDDKT